MEFLRAIGPVFNFLLLAGALFFLTRKRIRKLFQDRKERIADALGRAADAQDQARHTAEDIAEAQQTADAQAQCQLADAQRQAAANTAESIDFYAKTYGVRRVVLPRVLSAQEVKTLVGRAEVEVEAFVFGGLCVMAEGRCAMSSYVSGRSPNLTGVCSPPEAVKFDQVGEQLVRLPNLGLVL